MCLRNLRSRNIYSLLSQKAPDNVMASSVVDAAIFWHHSQSRARRMEWVT